MYSMVCTRPDIAWTLGRLAQYISKPAIHHGIALKNLLRYIRSSIKQKVRFGPRGANNDYIQVFTDADWASDKVDRKSFSGGVVMFYGGPISWASRKQNSVATSTADAEYIAMAMFAKQGLWIAQILKDIKMQEHISTNGNTVQMLGDNQGALALAKNPHLHERSKHIDICYHFIRDLSEKGKIEVKYTSTVDMIANGMTKSLQKIAFQRFKNLMGIQTTVEQKHENRR
ncbi:hypothetical protein K3495_g13257 [Podosphaera aphanis]|nr:hypothetical protein K3495_g13257 [Podosphaera aphanis]